jgi:hypothetical protein
MRDLPSSRGRRATLESQQPAPFVSRDEEELDFDGMISERGCSHKKRITEDATSGPWVLPLTRNHMLEA